MITAARGYVPYSTAADEQPLQAAELRTLVLSPTLSDRSGQSGYVDFITITTH